MSNSKTLTIKFDSARSAKSFMDDITDLIYWNDQERDSDDRCFEGPDESNQIGFSWDGDTFLSANSASRQIRQEVYGVCGF
ncbi:hypothetical protein SynRCC2555_00052 [Synechococcus sp. WH 8101]|nr:hypothetical protein SynRCC2555_00052 [Synechococcus sp. WH 8101]